MTNEFAWAMGVSRVAVLTGAGISTDSGIPDYRGPNGVWTRNPSAVNAFTYENFMTDTDSRVEFWHTYLEHPLWTAQPNAAHHALAGLDGSATAVRVITQNIDGLHQKAGLAARKVIELHGNAREVVCTKCSVRSPTEEILARVGAGDADPACVACGGILKLDVVYFGEYLNEDTLAAGRAAAGVAQVLVAIGSSLQVEPAASLCSTALEAGATLVIVNRDRTPYDYFATEIIREPIADVVPRITAALASRR